jgi:phospholipid transport system substrate-binding protein
MSATEETASGVNVDSRIELRDGSSYDVRWLVVRRGSGWKVRDAQVLGFWMSPFMQRLFENYISENGGNPQALILALSR